MRAYRGFLVADVVLMHHENSNITAELLSYGQAGMQTISSPSLMFLCTKMRHGRAQKAQLLSPELLHDEAGIERGRAPTNLASPLPTVSQAAILKADSKVALQDSNSAPEKEEKSLVKDSKTFDRTANQKKGREQYQKEACR